MTLIQTYNFRIITVNTSDDDDDDDDDTFIKVSRL